MTDNDIIKALECCKESGKCRACPLWAKTKCVERVAENALDLINRQKAEYQKLQSVLDEILVNERCNYENKIAELVTQKEWYQRQYNEICDNASLMGYESIVEKARAEAITEFAERLCEDRVSNDPVVIAVKTELKMMKGSSTEDNVVKCKDCEYLMFSDCYGECRKAYKGIVNPNDSCGKGKKRVKGEQE